MSDNQRKRQVKTRKYIPKDLRRHEGVHRSRTEYRRKPKHKGLTDDPEVW